MSSAAPVPVTPVVAPKKAKLSNDLLLTVLIIVVLVVVLYTLSRVLALQRRIRDLENQPPVDDVMMKGIVGEQMKSTVEKLREEIAGRFRASATREVREVREPREPREVQQPAAREEKYEDVNDVEPPMHEVQTVTSQHLPELLEVVPEQEQEEVLDVQSYPSVIEVPKKRGSKKKVVTEDL